MDIPYEKEGIIMSRSYTITFYDKNGALSCWHTFADSDSQAIVAFNNFIREQKRYSSGYNVRYGEIYRVE